MIKPQNIAILGCSGAIGGALLRHVAAAATAAHPETRVWGFSRGLSSTSPEGLSQELSYPNVTRHAVDYGDEASLAHGAELASSAGPLDLVIFAGGILHTSEFGPEKSLRDLSADKFHALFAANTIAPALVAKHFLPRLARDRRAVFAALSARVGSISDNRLGGWYSYRASKAALNMVIKTAAIETARKAKAAIVVGLHPGTVDSPLSKPFQANVPAGKLFTPDFCAKRLLTVIAGLTPEDTGKCFAWDGQEVAP